MKLNRTAACCAALMILIGAVAPGVSAAPNSGSQVRAKSVTPIVLFPAYHFTKMKYDVNGQVTDSKCPSSGAFQDWFLNESISTFSRACQDELMTLSYDSGSTAPMAERFHEQTGVTPTLMNYGSTKSAPFYEPMYSALKKAGYVLDENVVVAGYDSRLTPDMGGFLDRTKALIEKTYAANGDRAVHLVGHSNGPIYAQYLLTHTTAEWKKKYIQGFTPLAGNFPGQGLLYPVMFTGLNLNDFTFPTSKKDARISANMYATAPSTYLSMADPAVFGSRETVVQNLATGKKYTPADWSQLFTDANLPVAKELASAFIGSVKFTDAASFPNVDVYAEKGSGMPTAVGLAIKTLVPGQVVTDKTKFFLRKGDTNQEDITNNAVGVWSAMTCNRFALKDNPGIGHFDLPANGPVLARLIAHAAATASNC